MAPARWSRAVVADGLANPILSRAAPYDLLIANILAGPLTQLAPGIIRSLAPGAVLVLSGLLRNQEKLVTSFYRDLRFVSARARRALERAGAGKAVTDGSGQLARHGAAFRHGQALSDL